MPDTPCTGIRRTHTLLSRARALGKFDVRYAGAVLPECAQFAQDLAVDGWLTNEHLECMVNNTGTLCTATHACRSAIWPAHSTTRLARAVWARRWSTIPWSTRDYGACGQQQAYCVCSVHGVSGLRVCDASVIPGSLSANTNLPVIAIAERAADLILADAKADK